MKILLDENMPHDLVKALRDEGHEVESVHTLGIAGIKNGELHERVRDEYDLLFTKDALFNQWAKSIKSNCRIRYVYVTLPQKIQKLFVEDFVGRFRETDWTKHSHANPWPE